MPRTPPPDSQGAVPASDCLLGASPFGACLALLRKPQELRKMVDFVDYSSSGIPAPRITQTSTLTWA